MLLEMLIAIGLIACALPLATGSFSCVKREIEVLREIELQRLADLAFADVKAKLYRQEIPWDAVATYAEPSQVVEISLGTLGTKKYTQTVSFSSSKKFSQPDHACPKVEVSYLAGKQKLKKIFTYQVYLSIEKGHGQ